MIKVEGVVTLRVPYSVQLDISEEAFLGLSELTQDMLIENAIDWVSATRNATVSDFDVDNIEKVGGKNV